MARKARIARLGLAALLFALWAAPGAAEEPIAASRFGISIDGVQIATFSEADINLGANPPTVVLRQGNASGQLKGWHDAGRRNPAGRKQAVLVQYDARGKAVARYRLSQAWPKRIQQGRGAAAMETVTIVCESLQRVSP